MTGDPAIDYEVSSTHIGLVFNPIVFNVVAHRLAGKWPPGEKPAGGTCKNTGKVSARPRKNL
jgi:hypothetical protein